MPLTFNATKYRNTLKVCPLAQRPYLEQVHAICSQENTTFTETRKISYVNLRKKMVLMLYVHREKGLILLLRLPSITQLRKLEPKRTYLYGITIDDNGNPRDRVTIYKRKPLRKFKTLPYSLLTHLLISPHAQPDWGSTLSLIQHALIL